MVNEKVYTDYFLSQSLAQNPGLKTALLSDVSVWHEGTGFDASHWHMTFRVSQADGGPGRYYVHLNFETNHSPGNPIIVRYTTSHLVRYPTPFSVQVFRSGLEENVDHPLNLWVFDNLVREQITFMDLETKMAQENPMGPHHPTLLLITLIVELLQQGHYLPINSFEDRFLSNVDTLGFDITTWFEQI